MAATQFELRRFDARPERFNDEPILVTRWLLANKSGLPVTQAVYAAWKLKTRIADHMVAVGNLKTYNHFEKANVTLIFLRTAVRRELVDTIARAYPESKSGKVMIYGILLKDTSFEIWWDFEEQTLLLQKPRMIDWNLTSSG